MDIKKTRSRRPAIQEGLGLEEAPTYAGRALSPACPSVPSELAGKWIAWSPRRQIVASGDALSGVMADVASKGIEVASYRLVPRFGHRRPTDNARPLLSYDADPWPANTRGRSGAPNWRSASAGWSDDAIQIPLLGLVDVGAIECIAPL